MIIFVRGMKRNRNRIVDIFVQHIYNQKKVHLVKTKIQKSTSSLFTALLLVLFGSNLFAENNITKDDAYLMSMEEYDKGHKLASIKYLLIAEQLGSEDAYDNLCWICVNSSENNLTKIWCSQNISHCKRQFQK